MLTSPIQQIGRPSTIDPSLLDTNGYTVPSAALNGSAGRVMEPGVWSVSSLRIGVNGTSGNIALAIWHDNGSDAPGSLVVSTGSIACPAIGPAAVALPGAPFIVTQGDWLGIYCDNVAAQFFGHINGTGMLCPLWRAVRLTAIASLASVASNPTVATDTRVLMVAGA